MEYQMLTYFVVTHLFQKEKKDNSELFARRERKPKF
jgi:hypothetical protein